MSDPRPETSLTETPVSAAAHFDSDDPGMSIPPRSNPMPKAARYLLGVYVIAMFVCIFYFMIKLWPLAPAQTIENTDFFWGRVALPQEIRLILLAALAGALGAYVHLATSFADFAGNEQLTASWGWWYLVRPFIGMALAEIVYLSLRGGFLNTAGSATGAISVYGVTAVTSLTGLFSKQATDKLREVFETLFRTQQKVERKDPLPTVPAKPFAIGTEASATNASAAAAGAGKGA